MWRVALAFIAAIGLGSLFVLATAFGQAARAVRGLLIGLTMLVMLAGLVIGAAGVAEEAWWAAVLGGGIVLAALRFRWTMRRRRPLAAKPVQAPIGAPKPEDPWQCFEAVLDWVGRQQARRSRKAIAGFVAERDSPSLTHDHRALLLSCEIRVPELIRACLERCRNAAPRERDRYMDETLARLEQIGAEAERARREVREADDRRLQVLHRYFDGVAPGKDQAPGPR